MSSSHLRLGVYNTKDNSNKAYSLYHASRNDGISGEQRYLTSALDEDTG